MEGIIWKVITDRGFGFIEGDDGIKRFFLAKSVRRPLIFDTLEEGIRVTFETVDMGVANPAMVKGNGLRADNIRPVNNEGNNHSS
jgi:cold shock CspA family protein